MPPLSIAALRKQLTSGALAPLYVLRGPDETEKTALAAEFAQSVDDDLRAFNVDRLYGGESDVDRLIACANTLPMLAARRIVIVLEAEKLLAPKRESQAADEAQERLEQFVAAPPPHATVVFVCGAWDKRRRVMKRLEADAQDVECGDIADPAAAEQWVKTQAARRGVRIDAGAVRALVAQTGCDIGRLRAGFDRVVLYAMDAPGITAQDVRDAVPVATDAQDFGIANAIQDGNAREALRQLALALDGGAAPIYLMGQIRYAAEKLPSPRLPAAIEAVFRTDLALKSTGGEPRVLLERLVFELCGARGASGPSAGYGMRRPPYAGGRRGRAG
jgi:DNA polymerase III subunit delta